MTEKVTVALVGIGGFGLNYVRQLLNHADENNAEWVAAIDPAAERCQLLGDIRSAGVPIFDSLDAFLDGGESADLVVISAPIHLHKPLTIRALRAGSNVLCEKPIAARIQDALAMGAVERETGKFVAIGYQWSFSKAIQDLKQAVRTGRFGRPRLLKTMVLWPRTRKYYERASWAGALNTPDGECVLDSPASNATAHYLHNMFYVLGPTTETSTYPTSVMAETYRAKPITNYDTAAIRCRTETDAEVLMLTTHSVPDYVGPICTYEFEEAVVSYDWLASRQFIARYRDGRTERYGSPEEDGYRKLWQCVDAVREGPRPVCGVSAASAHSIAVNAAQESREVVEFPADLIQRADEGTEDEVIHVRGLSDVMVQCYAQNVLPAHYGALDWAQPGQWIDTGAYDAFPSRT